MDQATTPTSEDHLDPIQHAPNKLSVAGTRFDRHLVSRSDIELSLTPSIRRLPIHHSSSIHPSLTPPSSLQPSSAPSSPSNCHTCQAPFSRTTTESLSLLHLSYESPLFDDLDQDLHPLPDLSSPDTPSIDLVPVPACRSSGFDSSSPDSPPSLGSWWSDIPPHRRAHIIEADLWPIFTPSTPSGGVCESCSSPSSFRECWSSDALSRSQGTDDSHESSRGSSSKSSSPSPVASPSQSRSASSNNLVNLLVPTPLDHDEVDPLLSTSIRPDLTQAAIAPSLQTLTSIGSSDESHPESLPSIKSKSSHQTINKRRKRRDEFNSKLSRNPLAKSLRRLGRKLSYMPWRNLGYDIHSHEDRPSVAAQGHGKQKPSELIVPPAPTDSEPDQDVLDSRKKFELVSSWTLKHVQPQNFVNGSFMDNSEMEWSLMMVELETIFPNSDKRNSKARSLNERKSGGGMRRMRSPQPSTPLWAHERSSNQQDEDENRRDSLKSPACSKKNTSSKQSQRARRCYPKLAHHHHLRHHSASSHLGRDGNKVHQHHHHGPKSAIKVTRQLVSHHHPFDLLKLVLELETMRKFQDHRQNPSFYPSSSSSSQLKFTLVKLPPTSRYRSRPSGRQSGSPLKFEII